MRVAIARGSAAVSAAANPLDASKADLLARVAPGLRAARVPPGVAIEAVAWRRDRAACLERIRRALGDRPLAVRSSRRGEDRPGAGGAGRYRSLIGVPPRGLGRAVDRVLASYGSLRRDDQVLVQPALQGVLEALVAANRAPRDRVRYDAVSRARSTSSAAITRGDVPAETWYVAPEAVRPRVPAKVARARALLRELEARLGDHPFEVEVAVDRRGPWLLQVRPLAAGTDGGAVATPSAAVLRAARARAKRHLEVSSRVVYARARPLFGQMPDWNPAELLGEHPRPLARSLFDALIARRTWWRARAALGYRRPRSDRLVVAIAGRPYVDVRASFESLLPAGVGDAVAERAIAAATERLRARPELHDRVELEIAVSCRELDAERRLADLGLAPRDRARLAGALLEPTRRALDDAHLAGLCAYFEGRLARPRPRLAAAPPTLRAALSAARRELARPFALAARCDFVGASLLRSAVRRGALAPERLAALWSAVATGAGHLVAADDRDAAWRERFGDLRPGTFEIATAPYADWWGAEAGAPPSPRRAGAPFALRPDERRALAALLGEVGLDPDPDRLVRAAQCAARARESGKRALARGVAALLDAIGRFAAQSGLDRDAAGWLELEAVLGGRFHGARAHAAARRHAIEAGLRLPPLLAGGRDLDCVHHPETRPTFLGRGVVRAPAAAIGARARPRELAFGRVVAIESADPGYDWIFTRAPAALVTAFGGPHSHMALRAIERGCPTVLGLGVERFRRLAAARTLRIDFARERIEAEGCAP